MSHSVQYLIDNADLSLGAYVQEILLLIDMCEIPNKKV